MIEQVLHYHCVSRAIPILQIARPAKAIAEQHRFVLQTWQEDGLGPHEGFNVRLPSGPVLSFQSAAWKPNLGTIVEADLTEVASFGLESTIALAIHSQLFTEVEVAWRQIASALASSRANG